MPPRLVLVRQHPTPVITTRTPGAEGIRYGFEGGRVGEGRRHVPPLHDRDGGRPHVGRRPASATGRAATASRGRGSRPSASRAASSRGRTRARRSGRRFPCGTRPRAAGTSSTSAYRSMPTDGTRFLLNHAGEIWRAVSRTTGPGGHRRPVRGRGRRDEAGPRLAPLGGPAGHRLVLPVAGGGRWRAFYGSARTETKPIGHWLVGPAEAAVARRPVAARARGQPGPDRGALHREPDRDRGAGRRVAWPSTTARRRTASAGRGREDGVRWGKGQGLVVQPKAGEWAKEMRTPLGLVPEGGDRFTLFYTGFEQPPDWTRILDDREEQRDLRGRVRGAEAGTLTGATPYRGNTHGGPPRGRYVTTTLCCSCPWLLTRPDRGPSVAVETPVGGDAPRRNRIAGWHPAAAGEPRVSPRGVEPCESPFEPS